MNRYYLRFESTSQRTSGDGFAMPMDFTFWKPLIYAFIDYATSFEIQCLPGDRDGLALIAPFVEDKTTSEDMVIVKGKCTTAFFDTLALHPLDAMEKGHWFTITLYSDWVELLTIEQYGAFYQSGPLSIQQVRGLKAVLPKDFTYHFTTTKELHHLNDELIDLPSEEFHAYSHPELNALLDQLD